MHFSKRPISVLLFAATLAFMTACPANAYYWGSYGTRFYGTNLLYSIPYLASPLLGINRAPYSANPIYSASSFLRRSSQRALTAPVTYRPYYLESYKDDEPIYDPRSRNRPVSQANYGYDQVAHATWKGNQDPFYIPIPDGQGSNNFPPVAPPRNKRSPAQKHQAPYNTSKHPINARHSKPAANSAPIADGFVSCVIEQHGGNIESALTDPSTRSWAKALGLIDDDKVIPSELSPTRVHLIRQILMDNSLNSISKLDAIRILIPAHANRATDQGL